MESSPLGSSDIAILVTLHSQMDKNSIVASAPYVFDTTGKLTGTSKL
jgi:UDP-N-acetyl-D-glucosamine dehydrogenase